MGERDLNRSSSWFWKRREDVPGDIAEQIIERREGERSFRHSRPARQHPGRAASGHERMLPYRRLADSRITGDNQRRWRP